MKTLSIIVPCYNEEQVIEKSFERMKNVLDTLCFKSEIIFINDGSQDNTFVKLLSIADSDSRVKIISFSRNFGHQPAVTAGLNNCEADLAVIIDADLQDPPELIPTLIETLELNRANGVYCVRKKRDGEGFFKLISAKLFYRILNFFSEVYLPNDTGDFRLIDRKMIEEFNRLSEKGKYIRGLMSWMGFKQIPFYYERDARAAGETKYTFSKMLQLATTSLLYFSKKPLKIATSLGFVSVVLGILYGIWSVFGKIFGFTNANSGWTSIIVLIIFFGGIQLLTIGVLGTYLGTLFDEVKNRPEYIIDKKINL